MLKLRLKSTFGNVKLTRVDDFYLWIIDPKDPKQEEIPIRKTDVESIGVNKKTPEDKAKGEVGDINNYIGQEMTINLLYEMGTIKYD